jgi:hypothetical protein
LPAKRAIRDEGCGFLDAIFLIESLSNNFPRESFWVTFWELGKWISGIPVMNYLHKIFKLKEKQACQLLKLENISMARVTCQVKILQKNKIHLS